MSLELAVHITRNRPWGDDPEMDDLMQQCAVQLRKQADELARLRAAVADVLALTDTGSPEFLRAFGPTGNLTAGWRVVERIRERLLT